MRCGIVRLVREVRSPRSKHLLEIKQSARTPLECSCRRSPRLGSKEKCQAGRHHGQRHHMRHCERTKNANVDAKKLNCKTNGASQDEIASEYNPVGYVVTTPYSQEGRYHREGHGLVELCRVHGDVCRGQTHGEGNRPRKVAGLSVIVTDKKAADPANRLSEREPYRTGREHGYEWETLTTYDDESRPEPAQKATKPAEAPTAC